MEGGRQQQVDAQAEPEMSQDQFDAAIEAAAVAQAEIPAATPAVEPKATAKVETPVVEFKPDDQANNFREIREVVKGLKDTVAEKDRQIAEMSGKIDAILSLKKPETSEPEVDPWSSLDPSKGDDRWALERVKPVIDALTAKERARVQALQSEIDTLKADRAADIQKVEARMTYATELDSFITSHNLNDSAAAAITQAVSEGRVAGKNYSEVFANALTYVKGAGLVTVTAPQRDGGSKREPAKVESESGVIGGVPPGGGSESSNSDDYQMLRSSLSKALAGEDRGSQMSAFDAAMAAAAREQGS